MKTQVYIFYIIIVSMVFSCNKRYKPSVYDNDYSEIIDFTPEDTLFRVSKNEFYQVGDKFAFVNQKGDTIFDYGEFYYSFSDTIITFGIVAKDETFDMIGINQKGERLYEIYYYDNGPDFFSDGLMRILRDGKIGYIDKTGKIIIEPQFACASQFEDGIANVTYDCDLYEDLDGHTRSESDEWFFIDKERNKVNNKENRF